MRGNHLFFAVAAMLLLGTGAYAGDLDGGIAVSKAWVQAMPPSQSTSAAYMTITNSSQKEAVLVSASTDIAAAAELHQMSDVNGMMTMDKVSAIRIPAQGQVVLGPGGYHIMLIGLKSPVDKAGDMVSLTLRFQDGAVLTLKAQVKEDQDEGASSMPGMKM